MMSADTHQLRPVPGLDNQRAVEAMQHDALQQASLIDIPGAGDHLRMGVPSTLLDLS